MGSFHGQVFDVLVRGSLFYYSQKDLVSAFQLLYAYSIYINTDYSYDEAKSIEENYFKLLNEVMAKLREIVSTSTQVAISEREAEEINI